MSRTTPQDRIAVFGLGYVGCVSAACFADRGHSVIGVDVNPDKVRMIRSGHTTVVEERIGELIARVVDEGLLTATTDTAEAVAQTDVALICVGTPSNDGGGLLTEYLERVAEQIGAALAEREDHYTVVVRSTMLPGTCESVVIPILERASGRRAGHDFGVAVNPEFLREGSSVRDFYDPPKTVIGQLDDRSGDAVARLYEGLPGPVHRVDIGVAEMTKYADNSFHALKVAFANEIGAVSRSLGVDSQRVMEIFRADTKLNVSPAYLRPGYAFGGSCLPKDVRAILHAARHRDVRLPVLEGILPSNERQIDRAFRLIEEAGHTRVGLLGLSFKAGTDDLRESPLVELAERLLGRGYDLRIHDGQVALSQLQGANRAYITARIPHLERLMAPTAAAVVEHAQTVVIGSAPQEVVEALSQVADQTTLVDLVGSADTRVHEHTHPYAGIAW